MQHGTWDVDAAFRIAQRIVAELTDEIGKARTTALLVSLARGSQPRHSSEQDDYKDFGTQSS